MELAEHIRNVAEISTGDLTEITNRFSRVAVKKKTILLREGDRCNEYYYVIRGCLRLYFLDDKGIEQTIQFALEGWWMTDLHAFQKSSASSYFIQCLEECELVHINKTTLQKLMLDYPVMEMYFRKIYERGYAAALFRMKVLRMPKEHSFHLFENAYPNFVQRVPQKILASFLGFTPEYLSELRKKKSRE